MRVTSAYEQTVPLHGCRSGEHFPGGGKTVRHFFRLGVRKKATHCRIEFPVVKGGMQFYRVQPKISGEGYCVCSNPNGLNRSVSTDTGTLDPMLDRRDSSHKR